MGTFNFQSWRWPSHKRSLLGGLQGCHIRSFPPLHRTSLPSLWRPPEKTPGKNELRCYATNLSMQCTKRVGEVVDTLGYQIACSLLSERLMTSINMQCNKEDFLRNDCLNVEYLVVQLALWLLITGNIWKMLIHNNKILSSILHTFQ